MLSSSVCTWEDRRSRCSASRPTTGAGTTELSSCMMEEAAAVVAAAAWAEGLPAADHIPCRSSDSINL